MALPSSSRLGYRSSRLPVDEAWQTARPFPWHWLLFWGQWLLLPLVARAMALWPLANPQLELSRRLVEMGRVELWTLPQDLAIGALALCGVLLVGGLFRWPSPRFGRFLAGSLGTALFLAVHAYLLVDLFLYSHTGVRLDYEFLSFLAAWDSFTSSAADLGAVTLSVGAATLALVASAIAWFHVRWGGQLRMSPVALVFSGSMVTLALVSQSAQPAELSYATRNAAWYDLTAVARDAISDATIGDAAIDAVDEARALALIKPHAERFERISSEHPLARRTLGFDGPRTFELKLAPGERPHVVFLFMESFRAADIGALGGRKGVTPCFDRLSKEGVLFTNFYGNGVQTTHGALASLYGTLPPFSRRSPQSDDDRLRLRGIPDLFRERGYHTAYFYGGSLKFEDQATFFGRHGHEKLYGRPEIERRFSKAAATSWGLHDEYLMRFAAEQLDQQDRSGEPGYFTIFTISNHHPWKIPGHHRTPAFDLSAKTEHGKFLRTMHYSDHCLGMFMDELRKRDLARKTVVFVVADTSTPMGEHHDNYMLINYLYEENSRIPLLILADGRIDQPRRIDTLASQVDLLPTVMDLFEMTGVHHALGSTLARETPARRPVMVNPFALEYLAVRDEQWRYIHTRSARTSVLYDLLQDPQQRLDRSVDFPEQCEQYRQECLALARFVTRLFVQNRLAPPDEAPNIEAAP